MTLGKLQNEMIDAMKSGLTHRKKVISTLIAQIKTAAINNGCRDSIPEDFVDKQILKAKKQAQESIEGAKAANRQSLINDFEYEFNVINSFAPQLINDENEIRNILSSYEGERTKPNIMKWLKANYNNKIDMKIASKIVGEFL